MTNDELGPFSFHLSERMVLRIMPLLPADRPVTFQDVRAAIVTMTQQDAATPMTLQQKIAWVKENIPALYDMHVDFIRKMKQE